MATQPLIINEWATGMGDSPNTGLELVQNASIDGVAGSLQPNYAPVAQYQGTGSSVCTYDTGTNLLTLTSPTSALLTTGVAVTFSTTGSLPSGLSANTVYFLYKFNSTQVGIASSYANAQANNHVSVTTSGTGVLTVTIVPLGTINSAADMVGGIHFFFDSNGRLWADEGSGLYLMPGNTTTNSTGQGLAVFTVSDGSLTYLFTYNNAKVEVVDVTTQAKRQDPVGNSTWTTTWQSMTGASGFTGSHNALLGQDNIVYACDGRYVNSIQEVPGQVFAPGNSATYVWNSKALTLPANAQAQCLEQLGIDLLVGDLNTQYIYPWDRTSPSFDLPLRCPDIGIYGMKNIGNIVWILNGQRGIIYNTTGYLVQQVRKLPEAILQSTGGGANLVTWGGVSSKNGAFMFGVQPLNTTFSGVYLLYPDGRLILENTPTLGALVATAFSQNTGEFYYMGYAGGVDFIGANRYNSFPGTLVQSRFYTVGKKVNKATYSLLEVQLDQPGNSGGQVRVSYRTSRQGSWTVLATYTLDGTNTSFDTDIGLINIENIQIQVEVSGNGSGANATSVAEVRLF